MRHAALLMPLVAIPMLACQTILGGRSTAEPRVKAFEEPNEPPQACYIDWNWGDATLEIVGPDAYSYCDGMVAYGYRDYGVILYANGSIYGEAILCEFQGKEHYFAVWDEPEWEAGGEFCDLLRNIEELP